MNNYLMQQPLLYNNETMLTNSYEGMFSPIPNNDQNNSSQQQSISPPHQAISPIQQALSPLQSQFAFPSQQQSMSAQMTSPQLNPVLPMQELNVPMQPVIQQQQMTDAQSNQLLLKQQYPLDVTNIYQPLMTIFGEENFASVEMIAPQLMQLHIYGEIFSENGFVVRSDARKKHNIHSIGDALNKILNIFPCTFNYQSDDVKRSGFIAQQLQEVIPEMVHTDIDGQLSIDALALIPVVIEALKTLHSQINKLNKPVDKATEGGHIISDANKEINELLEKLKEENIENEYKFSFTLGHFWLALTLGVVFLICSLVVCLLYQDLPFIFVSLLATGICFIISVARMPKHVKRIDKEKIEKLFDFNKMNKGSLSKLKRSLNKVSIKQLQHQLFKYMNEKSMSFSQKSTCLSYLILINLNLGAFALSFIFGESLIRFFGIYIGLGMLFWGISIRFCKDYSFISVFLSFICWFVLAVVLCLVLIRYQPSLECQLYDFDKNNTIYKNNYQSDSNLSLILTTQLPWNCLNPGFETQPPLPNFSISPHYSRFMLSGNVNNIPSGFSTTVYLVCSRFIKLNCGTFTFV